MFNLPDGKAINDAAAAVKALAEALQNGVAVTITDATIRIGDTSVMVEKAVIAIEPKK